MSEGKTPPRSLDEVLAAWPAAERSALEWDESAERVLSLVGSADSGRLTRASSGVSDEDLLGPPLPTTPGEVPGSAPIETRTEGTGMTTESRERDRAGFRDLARLANMTPPPSSVPPVRAAETSAPGEEKKDWEENSGVIHLGALPTTDAAESKPKAAAAGVSASVAQSTMRSAGNELKPVVAARDEKRQEKRDEKKRGSRWVAISSVVAAAAVAAGVFFGMQRTESAPSTVAVASPPTPVAVAAQTVAVPATASPLPAGDRGVDPASLPQASAGATSTPALHGPVPSVAAAKPGAAPPAPTTDPALVAVVPTATAAPTASASLKDLMQQAAGVTSSPTATAATTSPSEALPAPGSVPLKPSQGAIQGSLGAALPSARGCLGPDDPISHATITFKSDGSVQSVGVSGGAVGKPAEACIRSALSKARVAPFAQPTFTATATVRPN